MSNTTQLRLDASRALSDFRTERLLKKIQKICPEVVTLNSRYIHFVNVDGALSSEEFHTLVSILDYGEEAIVTASTERFMVIRVWERSLPGLLRQRISFITADSEKCFEWNEALAMN